MNELFFFHRLDNVSDIIDDKMPGPGQTLEDDDPIEDV